MAEENDKNHYHNAVKSRAIVECARISRNLPSDDDDAMRCCVVINKRPRIELRRDFHGFKHDNGIKFYQICRQLSRELHCGFERSSHNAHLLV